VTYRAASAILGLSESAAARRVKKLARAGWLEEIERGKHRRRRFRLIGSEGGDR
jgi:DNA-binding Lrp family transcriptional regulator